MSILRIVAFATAVVFAGQTARAAVPSCDDPDIKPPVQTNHLNYLNYYYYPFFEGVVKLQFDVSSTGAVENVVLLEPVKHQSLEAAATQYVLHRQFQPATRDGMPVTCTTAETFNYEGLRDRR
jgi:TonB family protein